MSNGMFQQYYKLGYSPIPIFPRGKNPIIARWTQYCTTRATPQQIGLWDEERYMRGLNIGLACGPAGGIIAIDIDTDDNAILNICPQSSVKRRGARGEARFFKFRNDISSMSFPCVDILSSGRQVVVPPSIHPDTNAPYTWLTPDTLENISAQNLPDLDLSFLPALKEYFSKNKLRVSTGRNNKLVSIVSAMRCRGEEEMTIVKEVYDFDLLYHEPRLFTDADEGFRADGEEDALRNAWLFVSRVTKSLIERRLVQISNQDNRVTVVINDDENLKKLRFSEKEFPEPQGNLLVVKQIIEAASVRKMPNIALGGALALFATVFSNRIRWDDVWSNLYVMNLAPTGGGKSYPQRVVKNLLTERESSKLLGYGNYKSSSALVKNLVSRRVRIDIIDEVSSLFTQMKTGGNYQTELVEELCKLWSDSNGLFIAGEYSERENTATCYNPCVNILGSSTIEGIKRSVNRSMVIKGLLPRFLIFSHLDYGPVKDSSDVEQLISAMRLKIEAILLNPVKKDETVDPLRGPRYLPQNLAPPPGSDAFLLFRQITHDYQARIEIEPNETLKCMLTRAVEQIMKLSMIHAASREATVIDVQDITWGRKVFDVSLHNASLFLDELSVDSLWEADLLSVLSLIREKGFLTHGDIARHRKNIDPNRLKLILRHLLSAELIDTAKRSSQAGYTLKA